MHTINWDGLTCQDASPLSKGMYIPCGRPAVMIVWHNKDRRGYAMCDMCGDHNVRNRGGILLASKGLADSGDKRMEKPDLVVIHNGTFAYQLALLEMKPKKRVKRMIYFTGADNAEYLESLYRDIGCEVRRTGDGSEDYATWVTDHGEEK